MNFVRPFPQNPPPTPPRIPIHISPPQPPLPSLVLKSLPRVDNPPIIEDDRRPRIQFLLINRSICFELLLQVPYRVEILPKLTVVGSLRSRELRRVRWGRGRAVGWWWMRSIADIDGKGALEGGTVVDGFDGGFELYGFVVRAGGVL